MKRNILFCLMAFSLFVLVAGVAVAGDVAQGKCVGFDKEKMMITIDEYDLNFSSETPYGHPTGQISTYNASKALIGLQPELGDILRISYKKQGEENIALKVMNVSKQDLRKK